MMMISCLSQSQPVFHLTVLPQHLHSQKVGGRQKDGSSSYTTLMKKYVVNNVELFTIPCFWKPNLSSNFESHIHSLKAHFNKDQAMCQYGQSKLMLI